MKNGITVRVLGDSGPFSRMGKSIGYQIEVGGSRYLLDCGAPLFQLIGGHGLKGVNGIIITHCHDDHKRWFTDLALFNMYAPDFGYRVPLLTSEEVHEELTLSSRPALCTSLSKDSKNVVDIPFDQYIEHIALGPRTKYRIVSRDEGGGRSSLHVVDRSGAVLGPDRAKIIVHPGTRKPRMLFKAPGYNEWVEPEHFYPLSAGEFYEKDQNVFRAPEGFTIEALGSPVWHGVTAFGIRVRTDAETLVFSSDTAHNVPLWEQLAREKKAQKLGMTRREFDDASLIIGDINDYIERRWSEERLRDALTAFDNAVVIHDVSYKNSTVHTDYDKLDRTTLKRERVLLTHGPDRMTSEWILCNTGKAYRVEGRGFFELVGDRLLPLDADIYHKEFGRYFVGYRNPRGRYTVYDKEGYLGLTTDRHMHGVTPLYQIDLYEDLAGRYFPAIADGERARYHERPDGKVELVSFSSRGSTGKLVRDRRGLVRRPAKRGARRPAGKTRR